MEKKILDCGAGGNNPPLTLFYLNGFETHGIDISEDENQKAQIFCGTHDIKLNIVTGDIRDIPFEDESFSFVYSINTTVHLSKHDNLKAISEIHRVLKPEGLCCLNFISVN
ncbi:MAG: class I SAM-dependent methyltransferase, partial [Candidatus Kariarchaeaceae archaeon]